MLTEFSIGNYQAFNTPQRVPLKPITLIFGPNSAGKSSLLRSLLVARHAILNGKLSKSEGARERHPGSYDDMVRNGSSNPITFGFSVQPTGKSQEEALYLELSWREKEGAGLETTAWALKQKQANLATYSTNWNSKHLQINSLGDELNQIIQAANLETAEPGSEAESSLNEMAQLSIKRRLALQKNVPLPGTDTDQFRIDDCKQDENDLLTMLLEIQKKEGSNDVALGWLKQIETTIGSLQSAITTSIKIVDDALRVMLNKLIYHGPIRPICDEITKARQAEPGMTEWWNLAADPKLLAKVNGWLAGDAFKTQYRLEFDRLFPESSLKNVFYESFMDEVAGSAFQSKSDLDCSYRGSVIERIASDYEDAAENSLKEDLRDGEEEPSEMEIQNRAYAIAESVLEAHHYNEPGREYYEKLGPEEAEAFLLSGLEYCNQDRLRSMLGCANDGKGLKTLGGFDSARVKFSLASGRSRTSPSNMGIGFSQMMPLVASAFGSKDSLIVIEQPELHVHPALQMELADLFIESVAERNNRFLIETHSEHLILRLLRRIRETNSGALEPGKYPIRQDQVAVLYVEPGDNGSKVIELPITADGDFSVPWPAGFFAERASELF